MAKTPMRAKKGRARLDEYRGVAPKPVAAAPAPPPPPPAPEPEPEPEPLSEPEEPAGEDLDF